MTLPPFDLHRARSVDEARELLDRYGEDAAVICGGTELLLLLKLGFAAYGHLVDITGIRELGGIRAEKGAIVVGSTVTHREIERSPLVLERLPSLAAMERRVANIRVRNVGTLGGNLCFSDPHSDPATFLLALDAEAEFDGRRVLLSEFLVGPYETELRHGQLLAAVRVPLPAPGTVIAHRKLAFHERPAATVACAVRVESGLVAEARIAVGSVGARAVRATAAECAIAGKPSDDAAALAEAAALAAEASEAVDDPNGSAAYKEQLVRVLVARCFADATSRAEPRTKRR
jgi:carbon-monoxide dehydrogenase medium subunit